MITDHYPATVTRHLLLRLAVLVVPVSAFAAGLYWGQETLIGVACTVGVVLSIPFWNWLFALPLAVIAANMAIAQTYNGEYAVNAIGAFLVVGWISFVVDTLARTVAALGIYRPR